MTTEFFGPLPSGEGIDAWTLGNAAGSSVKILTLGGIVASLRVPDRRGELADVVLGFNTLREYLSGHMYFGALCGRIAGRVPEGELRVEGRRYSLPLNNGRNHLHGGFVGLDRRVWRATAAPSVEGAESLRLTYHSPDGEEGYPGSLDIAVTYTFTADNCLTLETEATSDQVTPLSLTQHSYFNLGGEGSGSIADHELQIHSDVFVPLNAAMTLGGVAESVAGKGNDFRNSRRIGDALPGLFRSHGDLYLLGTAGFRKVARVIDRGSGRTLEVSTDESCLQFYSAVDLDRTLVGKSGRAYGPHAGFCLECEGYAGGGNRPEFGDILVRPGRPQRRKTTYAFGR
ncbi:MAG: galactose-epimerase [Verrucomicrobia bacterium]|nr:galactose-epimerase [Verrucomicrobiota bacterium]